MRNLVRDTRFTIAPPRRSYADGRNGPVRVAAPASQPRMPLAGVARTWAQAPKPRPARPVSTEAAAQPMLAGFAS